MFVERWAIETEADIAAAHTRSLGLSLLVGLDRDAAAVDRDDGAVDEAGVF
jgi:hypothetical protein